MSHHNGQMLTRLQHGYSVLRTKLHEENARLAAEALANRREDPQDSSALAKKTAAAAKKTSPQQQGGGGSEAAPILEKGIELPSSFDKRSLATTIHTRCAWLVPRLILWGPSPTSEAEARDISLITTAFASSANDVLLNVLDVLTPAQITKAGKDGSGDRPSHWDTVDDAFISYNPLDLSNAMVGNRFSDMAILATTYLNDIVGTNDDMDSLVGGGGGGQRAAVGYVCCGDGQLGSAVVCSVLLSILHHPSNVPPLKAATVVGRLHSARANNSGVEITLVKAGGSGGSASQGVQWCGVAHAFLSSMAVKPFLKDVSEAAYREPTPTAASAAGPASRLQIIRQSRSSIDETADLSPAQLFAQFRSVLPCCTAPGQQSENAVEFMENGGGSVTPQHQQQQQQPASNHSDGYASRVQSDLRDDGQHSYNNSVSGNHQPQSLIDVAPAFNDNPSHSQQGGGAGSAFCDSGSRSLSHSQYSAAPSSQQQHQQQQPQHQQYHQQPPQQQQQQQQPPDEHLSSSQGRPPTNSAAARRGKESGGGAQQFHLFGGGDAVDDRFTHVSQNRGNSRGVGGLSASALQHQTPSTTHSLNASTNSRSHQGTPANSPGHPNSGGGGESELQQRRRSQMSSSINFGGADPNDALPHMGRAAMERYKNSHPQPYQPHVSVQYNPDAHQSPQTNLARRGSAVAESEASPFPVPQYTHPKMEHHHEAPPASPYNHNPIAVQKPHHYQNQQPPSAGGSTAGGGAFVGASPPPTRGPRPESGLGGSGNGGGGGGSAPPIYSGVALPPLLNANSEEARVRGPTSKTNWVVPGMILCGPMPDVPHDLFDDALDSSTMQYGKKGHTIRAPRRPLIKELANIGVDTIVSLIASGGIAREMVQSYSRLLEMNGGDGVVRHIHVSMEDGAPILPANKAAFSTAVLEAADIIRTKASQQAGGTMYIHCHGGHGRTGMFVSALLAELYPNELGCSGMKAVNFCDRLHGTRLDTEGRSSPESQEQRMSVMTLIDSIRKQQR